MSDRGTKTFEVTLKLTLTREYDHGWPDHPNEDWTYVEKAEVLSSDVPFENVGDLNADLDSQIENFTVIYESLQDHARQEYTKGLTKEKS